MGFKRYIRKTMLDQCAENAKKKNIPVQLKECDFRNMAENFKKKFDLVMSTGNSLPHVNNEDIKFCGKNLWIRKRRI